MLVQASVHVGTEACVTHGRRHVYRQRHLYRYAQTCTLLTDMCVDMCMDMRVDMCRDIYERLQMFRDIGDGGRRS